MVSISVSLMLLRGLDGVVKGASTSWNIALHDSLEGSQIPTASHTN